jgi:hypothetical protein
MKTTTVVKEIKSDKYNYRFEDVNGKVDIFVFDKNNNIILDLSLDDFKSLMTEFASLLKTYEK